MSFNLVEMDDGFQEFGMLVLFHALRVDDAISYLT